MFNLLDLRPFQTGYGLAKTGLLSYSSCVLDYDDVVSKLPKRSFHIYEFQKDGSYPLYLFVRPQHNLAFLAMIREFHHKPSHVYTEMLPFKSLRFDFQKYAHCLIDYFSYDVPSSNN